MERTLCRMHENARQHLFPLLQCEAMVTEILAKDSVKRWREHPHRRLIPNSFLAHSHILNTCLGKAPYVGLSVLYTFPLIGRRRLTFLRLWIWNSETVAFWKKRGIGLAEQTNACMWRMATQYSVREICFFFRLLHCSQGSTVLENL